MKAEIWHCGQCWEQELMPNGTWECFDPCTTDVHHVIPAFLAPYVSYEAGRDGLYVS